MLHVRRSTIRLDKSSHNKFRNKNLDSELRTVNYLSNRECEHGIIESEITNRKLPLEPWIWVTSVGAVFSCFFSYKPNDFPIKFSQTPSNDDCENGYESFRSHSKMARKFSCLPQKPSQTQVKSAEKSRRVRWHTYGWYFLHGRESRSTVKLEVVVDETAYTDMGEDV